jgi:hypothetical protein
MYMEGARGHDARAIFGVNMGMGDTSQLERRDVFMY